LNLDTEVVLRVSCVVAATSKKAAIDKALSEINATFPFDFITRHRWVEEATEATKQEIK
jgi:hypothetical protein